MSRPLAVAATMALLLTALASGQDPKTEPKKTTTPKSKAGVNPKSKIAPKAKAEATPETEPRAPELIVDRSRSFSDPGDEVSIYSVDGSAVYAATDMISFNECSKYENAKDNEGLKGLVQRGRIMVIEKYTPIKIIKGWQGSEATAFEVRVLQGDLKDTKVFVREVYAQRLIEKPVNPAEVALKKAKANAEAAKAKAQTPEGRAASLLSVAKNHEKSGKTKPALENYRKVVTEFGDTPSAKEASERIKALEGK